jgi:hypothetical protein
MSAAAGLRQSMIVVPTPEQAATLDALRRRWDPHVDLVPPHITIAFPAVPVADAAARFDALAADLAPFTVRLSAPRGPGDFTGPLAPALDFLVRRYPNARGWVVAVAEAGAEAMLALRRGASVAIPQPPELLDFPPYLTLGQTLDEVAGPLAAARATFAGLSWRVTEILLAQEDAAGRWSTAHRSPLRGTTAGAAG